MSSNQHNFDTAWKAFRAWTEGQQLEQGKSSMWQSLIRDFDASRLTDDDSGLASPHLNRSYGFLAKQWETLGLSVRRWLLGGSYALARTLSYARNKIWALNVAGLGVGHLSNHPAGLRWLKQFGLDAQYREFCDRFGFSVHSGSAIKSFYVSSVVESSVGGTAGRKILEIGGGLGVLASMIRFRIRPELYVIVDLPEMLLFSSRNLRRLYPEVAATFLYPGAGAPVPASGFVFCTPDRADDLPADAFDFACNIDSFQEMTEKQVHGYLELVQRVLKDGAQFLNINRRKFLEAEKFDNNPLLYPYARDNKVLRWETDLFMDRTLNYDRARLDGWLLRLERVIKS